MLRGSCVLWALLAAASLYAEEGSEAWLRYAALEADARRQYREALPAADASVGDSAMESNARRELIRGIRGMLGRTLRVERGLPSESTIVLGTLDEIRKAVPRLADSRTLGAEGYWLKTVAHDGARHLIIAGADEAGVLYGAFGLLRKVAVGESVRDLDERHAPSAPIRWLNLWDWLMPPPGFSVSRMGSSVLWENGHAREDLSRLGGFGRLLASVGINGCAISIVNANPRLLDPGFAPDLKRIAAALRPWGVRIVLPVSFGSPQLVGKLESFDPVDPEVAAWWESKVDELYDAVPDLAGFVMKADSEGTVGPSAYGRTHAQATRPIARALQPHGGLLFYRAFVYDHHLDWTNLKNDRARAAYDNFHHLDGQFDDNVVIQIKNGPIDFQARFRLRVGDQVVDEWVADDTLPTRRTEPDGTSSTRGMVPGVALRPGDEIRIEGLPDGPEDAALDYVELHPELN